MAATSEVVRLAAVPRLDWLRLRHLPWEVSLAEWPTRHVQVLSVRRGESRHEVLFVQVEGRRYALKETSPEAAEHEIEMLRELGRRGCRTLEPVGYVLTRGAPIALGTVGGRTAYMSGDTGYCVTRLAEHVLPQSILYRYPFSEENKRLLWNAIAALLLDLHEAGCRWGDPSLANILVDLHDERLTAVMADAETAELVNGPLSEGQRRQDLDFFTESVEWQAEDIRLARGLPEESLLVTEADILYFLSRYGGLRSARERARQAEHTEHSGHAGHAGHTNHESTLMARLLRLDRTARRLNALGYGVLNFGTRALHATLEAAELPGEAAASVLLPTSDEDDVQIATLRPAWYMRRVRELLGVRVPRGPAERIYHHISIHKWLLSERAGKDVGMDETIRDWLVTVHTPLLRFLAALQPDADTFTLYSAYADILDHTWEMSQREGRPIDIEEGAMDYALAQSRDGA